MRSRLRAAAAGLARARRLLERERLKHSALSESFLALTRLEERLDEELRKVRRGLTAVGTRFNAAQTAAAGALPRAP